MEAAKECYFGGFNSCRLRRSLCALKVVCDLRFGDENSTAPRTDAEVRELLFVYQSPHSHTADVEFFGGCFQVITSPRCV